MTFDLHTHSTASDGTLAPAELVARAHAQGAAMLALTDHDTVEGLPAARNAAASLGLRFINGIEFSTVWERGPLHVVGLNLDDRAGPLLAGIAQLQATRSERARRIGERLEKLGHRGALARAEVLAGGAVPGRVHFARHLVASGSVKNENEAFKRLLGAGRPAYVAVSWPVLHEVIGWIDASGGVAVLAHPLRYGMTATRLRRVCAAFRDAGGRGIEVLSGRQTREETAAMIRLAHRYGLYGSAGSDFHSPNPQIPEPGRVPALEGDLDLVVDLFKAG